jgi:hypothetical protein
MLCAGVSRPHVRVPEYVTRATRTNTGHRGLRPAEKLWKIYASVRDESTRVTRVHRSMVYVRAAVVTVVPGTGAQSAAARDSPNLRAPARRESARLLPKIQIYPNDRV